MDGYGLIGGISPTLADGVKPSDGSYELPANYTDASVEQVKYAITGQPALAENQAVRVALSTKAETETDDALLVAVAYEDSAGNTNAAMIPVPAGTEWSRQRASVIVPSGMKVIGMSVYSAASAPRTSIANPTLTYGGTVTLASAKHVHWNVVRVPLAVRGSTVRMHVSACPLSIQIPASIHW